MMVISGEQFLAITGAKRLSFSAEVTRGAVALAFGTAQHLAGGKFLDLDVIAWWLTDELTPAFTRKQAATFVRSFSDQWLEAVHLAEGSDEPVFFILGEHGNKLGALTRNIYEHVNAGRGRLSELADFDHKKAKAIPARMTLVNVSAIVARARQNARKIGIELPTPLVPPLDDPEFVRTRRVTRKAREVARVAG